MMVGEVTSRPSGNPAADSLLSTATVPDITAFMKLSSSAGDDCVQEHLDKVWAQLTEERAQRQLDLADVRMRVSTLEARGEFDANSMARDFEAQVQRIAAATCRNPAFELAVAQEVERATAGLRERISALAAAGKNDPNMENDSNGKSFERRVVANAVVEVCDAMKGESEWWHTEVIRLDAEMAKAGSRLDAVEEASHRKPKTSGGSEGSDTKTVAWLSEWAARLDGEFDSFRRNMDAALGSERTSADKCREEHAKGHAALERQIKVLQAQFDADCLKKVAHSSSKDAGNKISDEDVRRLHDQYAALQRNIDEVWHGLDMERQERQEKCQALTTSMESGISRLIKKLDRNCFDVAHHNGSGSATPPVTTFSQSVKDLLDDTCSAKSLESTASTGTPSRADQHNRANFQVGGANLSLAQQNYLKSQATVLATALGSGTVSRSTTPAIDHSPAVGSTTPAIDHSSGSLKLHTRTTSPECRSSHGGRLNGSQTATRSSSIDKVDRMVAHSFPRSPQPSPSPPYVPGSPQPTQSAPSRATSGVGNSAAELIGEIDRSIRGVQHSAAAPSIAAGPTVAETLLAMQERSTFLNEIAELRERNVVLREEIGLRDRKISRQQVSISNPSPAVSPAPPIVRLQSVPNTTSNAAYPDSISISCGPTATPSPVAGFRSTLPLRVASNFAPSSLAAGPDELNRTSSMPAGQATSQAPIAGRPSSSPFSQSRKSLSGIGNAYNSPTSSTPQTPQVIRQPSATVSAPTRTPMGYIDNNRRNMAQSNSQQESRYARGYSQPRPTTPGKEAPTSRGRPQSPARGTGIR